MTKNQAVGWAALVCGFSPAGMMFCKADTPVDIRRTPIVDVFEKTHGAVVNISSTKIVKVRRRTSPLDLFFQDFESFYNPPAHKYRTTSVGSGFIIHETGYIVTNAHVVDRTTDVKITLDDRTSYDAQIVATDPDHDLALLKVAPLQPLPVIKFGDSDDLMVGETVIAIGNPLGYPHTLTTGVVSATKRDLELFNKQTKQAVVYADLIQTDAGINAGNSGGPLLNVLGELIGINTAIRSDAQNIGFAISINTLKKVLPVMIRTEQRNRYFLGLLISDQRRIVDIEQDSPASRAGLAAGDAITQVDGRPITSDFDFYLEMVGHQPGDRILFDFERGGKPMTARVLLQERPRPDGGQLALAKLGIRLNSLTRAQARESGLGRYGGLIIAEVEPGGPAHAERIEPGEILTALDRYYVSELDEVGQILERTKPGDRIFVRILRLQGELIYAKEMYLSSR